jgi:hypothetical protein
MEKLGENDGCPHQQPEGWPDFEIGWGLRGGVREKAMQLKP